MVFIFLYPFFVRIEINIFNKFRPKKKNPKDIFCIFNCSLFFNTTASLILILLGTFCGLKARSKNIGKITAEEDEDTETAKKLKKSKEKWNCCADFAHNISLASCIIGIIMLLFFIYINVSSL